MEHLIIDDFIRVEKHLSKKLTEACGEFKKFVMIGICEEFNGQPLSRNQFRRIYRKAYKSVKHLFKHDCWLLGRFCPGYKPLIREITPKAMMKIKVLHGLEWRILVSQFP